MVIETKTQSPDSLHPACWAAAIRFAAGEVDKLAAHFVGNTKTDGTRDSMLYEQGIGCERAGKMLREIAILIELQDKAKMVGEAGAMDGARQAINDGFADLQA